MKPTGEILIVTLAVGAALGVTGSYMVSAQQSEKRTVLVNTDLVGPEGYEVRIWRTDIPPGVVGAKHYHPGTECIYVLEGALNLEEGGASANLKAGEAHCACA
jgi:quercetin dioxygenase-like cupin family protein